VNGPKLIRDLVPQRAAERGAHLTTRVADPDEMPALFRAKLAEEIGELYDAGTEAACREELADVLEVLYAIADLHGITPVELETERQAKADRCGGFARRLVWDGAP
jgi:predicted house-cleaning noncanonical NTP pyrophosphatase (MazG superfamily)